MSFLGSRFSQQKIFHDFCCFSKANRSESQKSEHVNTRGMSSSCRDTKCLTDDGGARERQVVHRKVGHTSRLGLTW